ncbi:DUF4132 domain-containing protein [Glycomyces sp. NPDC047010]|uniref:DUF4132 domain-containing protein n=1 Tax=Glycomyces sp. NPDC047010 TaxID=3155023 RepID=UPI0033DBD223
MDLPDEHVFALTPEQLAEALPRRGGRSARPFAPRGGDTEWWRYAGIEQRREQLDRAAAELLTAAPIAAALRSYLDGTPDPLGAAAAFLVDDAVGTPLWREPGYSQYDAWLGEHGAEFAAAAVLDYFAVAMVHPVLRGVPDPGRYLESLAVAAVPADPDEFPWRDLGRELARLRTHLADMPEPEYQRVTAVFETKDRNPIQRAARAYLAPERTDWVDAVCDERPHRRFANFGVDAWLLQCASTMDQLERARLTRLPAVGLYPHVVWTLLDGIGLDCTPLLTGAADLATIDDGRRDFVLDVLASLPRDEAVRHLLERIARHRTWDRLQGVAARFPVRTLRAVADLAVSADREDLTRLTGLVQSHPVLSGPARDALDPADRDRVDALLEYRGLPPETPDVPAALAQPPSRKAAPAWTAMCAATPVLLKGRKARLPQAAVAHLIAALALDTPKSPHPAVDAAIATCDAASLRELSWGVFTAWDLAADRGNPWAFAQLVRFADDEGVRRLEALILQWPGRSLHKRAVRGLELLGAIGTEEALAAVHRVSRTSAYKGLKKAALAEVDRIAARLGLDEEQLLDRLVPDFELDADGRMALDFGPRAFTVGFDEQLKPFAIDPKGKVRRSLPKPAADDDPEAAADAAARFDRLKRSLKSVGTEQAKRLERAMAAGRVWARADFQRYFAGHALMRHLARRLVWQYTEGREWTSFRVAEDGTFADVHDNARRLPERCAVRLPHPLLLGPEVPAWAEVLADYELAQPFPQLARTVVALTPEEAATGRLARFEGLSVPVGPLIGLRRGRSWWSYSDAYSAPGEPLGLKRELPGDGFLLLGLAPGIDPAAPSYEPRQTLKAVRLSTGESADDPAPRGLDPVAASEVLSFLEQLTVR